jgi:RNA polymerase sigma-70 factor (ECF subfamily)
MFREYRNGLLSFLTRTLRNREDAEDGLTQTFIKAWNHRARFRGETTEKRWLYRIARCVAIDLIRARGCQPVDSLDALGELVGTVSDERRASNPLDVVTDAEVRRETRALLGGLAPDQRQLVELHYFDSHSYEEISVLLGIPVSQVKGRLHRVRRLLQREFAGSR